MPSSGNDNIIIYEELISYPSVDQINAKELASRFGIAPKRMGGLIGNMSGFPYAYNRLIKAGYKDENIPPWVMRPAGTDTPYDTFVNPWRKNKAESEAEDDGDAENDPPPPTDELDESEELDPPENELENEQELPVYYRSLTREAEPNEEEVPPNNPAPQHQTSPWGNNVLYNQPIPAKIKQKKASEALANVYRGTTADDNGSFQLPTGEWVRRHMTPEGKYVFVQVEPPEEPDDALFSEVAYSTIRTNMMAIAKKISMNPSVLQSYSYSIARGFIGEDTDLGEFINKCVAYSMRSLFGVKFGVVKVGDGAIDRYERTARHYQNGGARTPQMEESEFE